MEPKIQSYSELTFKIPYQENPQTILARGGQKVQVWIHVENVSVLQRLVKTVAAIALVILTAFTALFFQKCRTYCKEAMSATIERKYYIDWETLPEVMKKGANVTALQTQATLKYDPLNEINKQFFIQTAQFLSNALKQDPNKSHAVCGLSLTKDLIVLMTQFKDNKAFLLQILKSMEIVQETITEDIFFKEYPQLLNAFKEEVFKIEEEMAYLSGSENNFSSVCALTEILKEPGDLPADLSDNFNTVLKAINKNSSFQDILEQIPLQDNLNISHTFYQVMNWQKKFIYDPHLNQFFCRDGSIVFANFMQLKGKLSVYFGEGYTLVSLPLENSDSSKHTYKGYCLYCADPTKLEENIEKFKSEIGENWSEIQKKSQVLDVFLQMPILNFSREVDSKKSFIQKNYPLNDLGPDREISFTQKFHVGLDTKGIKLNVNQIEGENIIEGRISLRYPIKLDQPFVYFSVATHKITGKNTLLPTLIVNDAEFLFQQNEEKNYIERPTEIPFEKSTLLTSNEITMELAKDPKNWNPILARLKESRYIENKSPISLTTFEIGTVKIKVLNYTRSDVSFNKERHLLLQGRLPFRFNMHWKALPINYSEDDCYVIVFNHNKFKGGGIAILDHDVGQEKKYPLFFYDNKGLMALQEPPKR